MLKSILGKQETSSIAKPHVSVVIIFIVAASMLVVLTTFAINMLTATGDLNKLLVRWSQSNNDGQAFLAQYIELGKSEQMEAFLDAREDRRQTAAVIDELMRDDFRKLRNSASIETLFPLVYSSSGHINCTDWGHFYCKRY